jgi:hypothetical protein
VLKRPKPTPSFALNTEQKKVSTDRHIWEQRGEEKHEQAQKFGNIKIIIEDALHTVIKRGPTSENRKSKFLFARANFLQNLFKLQRSLQH